MREVRYVASQAGKRAIKLDPRRRFQIAEAAGWRAALVSSFLGGYRSVDRAHLDRLAAALGRPAFQIGKRVTPPRAKRSRPAVTTG